MVQNLVSPDQRFFGFVQICEDCFSVLVKDVDEFEEMSRVQLVEPSLNASDILLGWGNNPIPDVFSSCKEFLKFPGVASLEDVQTADAIGEGGLLKPVLLILKDEPSEQYRR